MTCARLVMAQRLVTVLLAIKPLFWMETNANAMILIILILLIQPIVTKGFAKNALITMEIARDYKLVVFNVTSNGYFSFKSLKDLIKFNMQWNLRN